MIYKIKKDADISIAMIQLKQILGFELHERWQYTLEPTDTHYVLNIVEPYERDEPKLTWWVLLYT